MRRVLLTWLIIGAADLHGCGETGDGGGDGSGGGSAGGVEDDGDYVELVTREGIGDPRQTVCYCQDKQTAHTTRLAGFSRPLACAGHEEGRSRCV